MRMTLKTYRVRNFKTNMHLTSWTIEEESIIKHLLLSGKLYVGWRGQMAKGNKHSFVCTIVRVHSVTNTRLICISMLMIVVRHCYQTRHRQAPFVSNCCCKKGQNGGDAGEREGRRF